MRHASCRTRVVPNAYRTTGIEDEDIEDIEDK